MYKLISLLMVSASISAAQVDALTKIGSGEMRYLFWTIYEAEYYQKKSNINGTNSTKDPSMKALRIEYFKSIDKSVLIQATVDQWQHLGYKPADIEMWIQPLETLWPDVKEGSTLTVVVENNGQSQFYFNGGLLGKIEDNRFGNAFLSIWLSEHSSEPKLRQQLLGIK